MMGKFFSAAALILALLGGMAAPAAACQGTVHLPSCGQSGNYC